MSHGDFKALFAATAASPTLVSPLEAARAGGLAAVVDQLS